MWGCSEVGSEQNIKKRNEGGWKTSYYNNIMYNVYDITAVVIKDANCHDSILWCAIWFKTDSLLRSKQFTHKIRSFIYLDDLASCCGYPLLSFPKVLQKKDGTSKAANWAEKKKRIFFSRTFFFFPTTKKWFQDEVNVWWTCQPLCEDVWHAPMWGAHAFISQPALHNWWFDVAERISVSFSSAQGCNLLTLEGFGALGPHR